MRIAALALLASLIAGAAAAQGAPPVPSDHAADRDYDPALMAVARDILRREHGGSRYSKVMLTLGEVSEAGDWHWEAQASTGGDIHRAMITTRGAGSDQAEVQGLYSRAIGPYFDARAGLRQDLGSGPRRTHLVAGVEGLAPYWFEVGSSLFLSNRGELTARAEASYDLRLTQRLILQPRAEVTLAAQDIPALEVGSGLGSAELGLRLRYDIQRTFSPYVGVTHERLFGQSADFARAAGERSRHTALVVGLQAFF